MPGNIIVTKAVDAYYSKSQQKTKEKSGIPFAKLKDYVQLNIIEKGKNVKMNHIVEMHKNLVEQSGEEETGLKVQNERQ